MIKWPGTRLVGALLFLTCLTAAADGHRLMLFATVEDGAVRGYGFFVGGGRPNTARLVIRNGAGVELFNGPAGADGSFSFRPGQASNLILTMDAGDGHVADAHIAADRFAANGTLGPVAPARAAETAGAASHAGRQGDEVAGSSPADLSALIDRSVDRAVARQIAPLLEAYAAAQSRVRFNDVVSGVAVIIGLAGAFLWASSRRRADDKAHTTRGDPQ